MLWPEKAHRGACTILFHRERMAMRISRRQLLSTVPAALLAAELPFPALARRREASALQALEFLESLTSDQRAQALFPFAAEQRRDWHYVPRQRPGVALKALSEEQRGLLWRLMATALSERGVAKIRDVIKTEAILADLTGDRRRRDPENYAAVFFGDPAARQPWAWRFEGHHLALNFTVIPGQGLMLTPAFFGANPAITPSGHPQTGFQALRDEERLAFQLLNGLPAPLREQTVIDSRSLGDIVTGPGREDSLRERQGLALGKMAPEQRDHALALLDVYLQTAPASVAGRYLQRIREAGIDELYFAWAGGRTPGSPHYYRLHGPTLIIEYDNTQGGGNHVHSVWNDPQENFGQDLLAAHYASVSHG